MKRDNKLSFEFLLVIALIILGTVSFMFSRFNVPSSSEIIVTTDKTIYKQGEIVKITVKNNLNKPIWYAKKITCGSSSWILENCLGKEIPYYQTCLWVTYQHDFTKLNPGEILTREWNGMILDLEDYEFKLAESGCYKIVFPYSMKEKVSWGEAWGEDKIEVRSSRFVITPLETKKNSLIGPHCNTIEDCSDFDCPELVEDCGYMKECRGSRCTCLPVCLP